MRRRRRYVWALVLAMAGCAARPPSGGGSDAARVTLERAGEPLSLTGELVLRLSAPLDEASVSGGAVMLVPYERGDPCTVDLACRAWGGRCVDGACQRDRVDDLFVRDAATAPLSQRRAAQTLPLSLSLSDGGTRLHVAARVALAPRRAHTLLVTRALRGVAGRAVAPAAAAGGGGPAGDVALRARVVTGDGSRARPTMTLLSPPAGSTDLPRNLTRVVVGFSRAVVGVAAGRLSLLTASGAAIALRARAGDARCAGSGCVVLAPSSALLPPLAELSLSVRAGITDAAGRPLFVGEPARLATADASDTQPPELSGLRAFVADGCLIVRARSDEPADAVVELPAWGSTQRAATIGATTHELALRVAPGTRASARLSLRDLAGNTTTRSLTVDAPVAPPPLVISEVLANPRGPEPAQEWVELVNRGDHAVALGGFTIDDGDDGDGARALPQLTLAAGQRAVVVGASYRVGSSRDVAPRDGALIVRLDGPIGALGLANAGEPVVLRDRAGRVVSSYGGHYSTAGSALEGASVERVDLGACDVAASWRVNPAHTSTPGW